MPTDDRWDDERDEDFEDDRDRTRRRAKSREELVRDARQRLATPGLLLILSALLMLLWGVAYLGLTVSGYDYALAMTKWGADMQPPGPQKQQMELQVQQLEGRDRTGEYIQNGVIGGIGAALDLVILLGGIRMRQVRGYGLALAASICAIIPLNSCCCLGLPLGIWTLVVLMNPDVKAAFAANSRRAV